MCPAHHRAVTMSLTSPTGRLEVKLPDRLAICDSQKVHLITFQIFFLPFINVFYGIFTRWTHEINPWQSGNIPSAKPPNGQLEGPDGEEVTSEEWFHHKCLAQMIRTAPNLNNMPLFSLLLVLFVLLVRLSNTSVLFRCSLTLPVTPIGIRLSLLHSCFPCCSASTDLISSCMLHPVRIV